MRSNFPFREKRKEKHLSRQEMRKDGKQKRKIIEFWFIHEQIFNVSAI